MDYSEKINEIEAKKKILHAEGKDITQLIREQIRLFKKARNEMLRAIEKRGIKYNLNIAEAEIAQLSAIISLSEEINEPANIYKDRISEIQREFVGSNVTIEVSE